MKAEGGKKLSNDAAARGAFFVLHPSAFILLNVLTAYDLDITVHG
jgi:hypothetical protein